MLTNLIKCGWCNTFSSFSPKIQLFKSLRLYNYKLNCWKTAYFIFSFIFPFRNRLFFRYYGCSCWALRIWKIGNLRFTFWTAGTILYWYFYPSKRSMFHTLISQGAKISNKYGPNIAWQCAYPGIFLKRWSLSNTGHLHTGSCPLVLGNCLWFSGTSISERKCLGPVWHATIFPKNFIFAKTQTSLANKDKRIHIQIVASIPAMVLW